MHQSLLIPLSTINCFSVRTNALYTHDWVQFGSVTRNCYTCLCCTSCFSSAFVCHPHPPPAVSHFQLLLLSHSPICICIYRSISDIIWMDSAVHEWCSAIYIPPAVSNKLLSYLYLLWLSCTPVFCHNPSISLTNCTKSDKSRKIVRVTSALL